MTDNSNAAKINPSEDQYMSATGMKQDEDIHEVTLDDALRLAQGHHQNGNLIIADRTYRDILRAVPDHFPTVMFLGVLLYQRGNHQEAMQHLKTATEVQPDDIQPWINLGVVCADAKLPEDAVMYFDRALAIDPVNIEALSNKSFALWKCGDFEASKNAAEAALDIAPNYLPALNNAGIAYGEMQMLEDAEAIWQKIIALQPDSAKAYGNWANTLREMGRIALAEEKAREAYDLDNEDPSTLNNLANILRDRGFAEEALAHYKKATDIEPEFYAAHYNAAIAYHELERFEESVIAAKYAKAFNPNHAPSFRILSKSLGSIGRFNEATEAAQRSVFLDPESAESHLTLAECLLRIDRYDEGEAAIREALSRGLKTARSYFQLAEAYDRKNDPDLAIEAIDKAIEIAPEMTMLYIKKAQYYQTTPHIDKAWHALNKAEELAPDSASVLVSKADMLLTTNNKTEAEDLLRQAIKQNSRIPNYYLSLASVTKIKEGDTEFDKMMELYKDIENLSPIAQSSLHFALSYTYEHMGDLDKAFEHLELANQTRLKALPEHALDDDSMFDSTRKLYSPAHFKEYEGKGSKSDVPIFIVGMPRSGTTLTEQIISSHPDVCGAGELIYVGKSVREKGPLAPEKAAEMGDYCVSLMKKLDLEGTARHITDKLPANFLRLGYIKTILPNAKIIHCMRNPLDTCLSCYKQNFARGQYWSYDQKAMAREYKEYLKMMAYWREVLPEGSMLEITYEDTVENFEEQARKMIDYIGLEWNDACLTPHKQKRSVLTASKAQVIKPVYKSSVQKWKKYEKYLQPLVRELLPEEALPENEALR